MNWKNAARFSTGTAQGTDPRMPDRLPVYNFQEDFLIFHGLDTDLIQKGIASSGRM
jgi:hypothetical protein